MNVESLQIISKFMNDYEYEKAMEMRGVENRDTHITTSSVRGVFSTNPILKSEFLNKIQ